MNKIFVVLNKDKGRDYEEKSLDNSTTRVVKPPSTPKEGK